MNDDGVHEIKVGRKARVSVSGCGVNQAEMRKGGALSTRGVKG